MKPLSVESRAVAASKTLTVTKDSDFGTQIGLRPILLLNRDSDLKTRSPLRSNLWKYLKVWGVGRWAINSSTTDSKTSS